ncbi:MAG: hypothetical protein WBM50_02630 [Acidimicrobiales bacterium]
MPIHRTLLAGSLLLLLTFSPHGGSDQRLSPEADILGTPIQRLALREAQLAFSNAGLALPPVEVRFSDHEGRCHGHVGYFRASTESWQILICSELDFVVYHELAHAWLKASLTAEDRERYLAHRGLESWNSPRVEWRHRGFEDAAFIIQQNVMPRTSQPALEGEWKERVQAYELLTGRASPLVAAQHPPTSRDAKDQVLAGAFRG